MRKGALALGILVVFLFALRSVYDFDVWFNLRLGDYILQTALVPHHEAFLWSETSAQVPYVANDEWGFAVILRLVWQLLGETGLSILMALCVVGIVGFSALAARRRGASWLAVALISWLGLLLLQSRLMPRAQLVTDVFLSLFVLVGTLPRRFTWLFPALMLIWCNLHAGCFIGIVYLGALAAGDLVARRWADVRALSLAAGASLIATVVCPAGPGLLRYLLNHFVTRPLPVAMVEEWRPLWLSSLPLDTALLVGLIGFVVLGWRRQLWPRDVVVLLVFGLFGMSGSRNVAEFVAADLAALALAMDALVAPLLGLGKRLKPPLPEAFACLALASLALWLGWQRLPLRHEVDAYPENALVYVRSHHLPRQMFTTYHFGGYLAWRGYPDYLPFIHGFTPDYSDRLLQDYVTISVGGPAADAVLDRYGVQSMLVGYGLSPGDITEHLLKWLERSPHWKLVYWDDVALVYVRRSPLFAALPSYDHVLPGSPDTWTWRSPEAEAELQRATQEMPSVLAWCWLGHARRDAGKLPEAAACYREAIALNELNPLPHASLGQLLARQGDVRGGLSELERAYSLSNYVGHAYNIAVLHARLGETKEAGRWVRTALRLDPSFAPAHGLADRLGL